MKKFYCITIFIAFAISVSAQQSEVAESEQEKTNDLGFGIGAVHLINDAAWAPGLHLHYSRSLDAKQRFSIGPGLEFLFGDHKHASATLALEYSPLPSLSFGYGPGLEFPVGNSEEDGIHLIHHLELSYEFDLGFMEIGPVVEYGFRKGDQHFMLGVHSGYNF